MNKKKNMPAWLIVLLTFLEKRANVRTYEQLAMKVGKSIAHVRRYLGPYVITSLNKDRTFVASKKTVTKK